MSAQSLIEQLGGLQTDITLSLEGRQLEVVDQFIIKRAVSDYDFRYDEDGYGYGYGYESYHFEFSLVGVRLDNESQGSYNTHRIAFLDENGKVLGFISTRINALRRFSNSDAERLNCYNIDLKGVPLTVLQHCRTIKITPSS